MAGSRGGKHSKGKGKSKSKTNQKMPETIDSKVDQSQISNEAHKMGTSKGNIPESQTQKIPSHTESELEELLYLRLEDTYAKARKWLLSKGYGMEEIERAILHGRYFHGPLDQLTNYILTSSVNFIEQKKVEAKGEAFKDTHELYKTMVQTLVDLILHAERLLKLQRTDAIWLLLVRSWGCFPSTTPTSHLRSILAGAKDASAPDSSSAVEKVPSVLNISSSSKKVRILERISSKPALVSQLRQNIPILADTIRKEIGASVIDQQDLEGGSGGTMQGSDILGSDFLIFLDEECLNITRWLESCPDDPKSAIIVGLMLNIKNLQQNVNVNKEWAQRKVRDSAKRLSKDLLEFRTLKVEKVDIQYWKDEKVHAEESCRLMLREVEFSLKGANCEIVFMNERVDTLEITNANNRAETEAIKLSAYQYEDNLNNILNKERKCKKMASNIEKQILCVRVQSDEENQRVLQLQLEDSQADKETKESEGKWRHEIVEKEHVHAFLAEETTKATMRKDSLKAQLLKLRQEFNSKGQLKKDEHLRLEDELSRLCLSRQLSHISLEGNNFLYDGRDQVTSSSSSHWKCIFCQDNDVCVVLLPCTHQVLCIPCYEEKCNTVDGRCPYCHTEIQQGIKVFGHSS